MDNTPVRQRQLAGYRAIKERLGDHEASATVAKRILQALTVRA